MARILPMRLRSDNLEGCTQVGNIRSVIPLNSRASHRSKKRDASGQ